MRKDGGIAGRIFNPSRLKPGRTWTASNSGAPASVITDEVIIGKKYDTIVAYKLESGAEKVAAIRRRLDEAGQYGTRVAVHVGEDTTVRLPPIWAIWSCQKT